MHAVHFCGWHWSLGVGLNSISTLKSQNYNHAYKIRCTDCAMCMRGMCSRSSSWLLNLAIPWIGHARTILCNVMHLRSPHSCLAHQTWVWQCNHFKCIISAQDTGNWIEVSINNINPRRMHEGYGSCSVSVSVTTLAATCLVYMLKTRYRLGFSW